MFLCVHGCLCSVLFVLGALSCYMYVAVCVCILLGG